MKRAVAPAPTAVSRNELVHQIAAKSGQTLAATQETLQAFTQTVGELLATGKQVRLMGFGTWEVRRVGARRFRPIHHQEDIETLPDRNRVSFRVGTDLARVAKVTE